MISSIFSSRETYIKAADYTPTQPTSSQLLRGMWFIWAGLPIVFLLLLFAWRHQAYGLLLILLFVFIGLAALPVMTLFAYGISTAINADYLAERREQALDLDRHGMVTTSQILKRWSGFADIGDSTAYYVLYISGQHTIQQSVPKALYRKLQVGQTVRIRYLPARPQIARL